MGRGIVKLLLLLRCPHAPTMFPVVAWAHWLFSDIQNRVYETPLCKSTDAYIRQAATPCSLVSARRARLHLIKVSFLSNLLP
ncbi:uncharacterized protein P174DRAFT_441311 [Aspergillus novofumigatus IBT 16806]|uniref:Secreted protein n=1 Tax=Aspergillus novofumigatus (strain IBT 16806) TaxID=1392255 RepID=A0A2I1C8S2_ASPN1|nr:uncharacterized protein P174DRAFT_441311 [Aspergillus novofumigatus IBT 16806]PKX94037.1 hypothetical protein P174DRAFT_441311 [Aspergillus novofumigatus IBT 16806]